VAAAAAAPSTPTYYNYAAAVVEDDVFDVSDSLFNISDGDIITSLGGEDALEDDAAKTTSESPSTTGAGAARRQRRRNSNNSSNNNNLSNSCTAVFREALRGAEETLRRPLLDALRLSRGRRKSLTSNNSTPTGTPSKQPQRRQQHYQDGYDDDDNLSLASDIRRSTRAEQGIREELEELEGRWFSTTSTSNTTATAATKKNDEDGCNNDEVGDASADSNEETKRRADEENEHVYCDQERLPRMEPSSDVEASESSSSESCWDNGAYVVDEAAVAHHPAAAAVAEPTPPPVTAGTIGDNRTDANSTATTTANANDDDPCARAATDTLDSRLRAAVTEAAADGGRWMSLALASDLLAARAAHHSLRHPSHKQQLMRSLMVPSWLQEHLRVGGPQQQQQSPPDSKLSSLLTQSPMLAGFSHAYALLPVLGSFCGPTGRVALLTQGMSTAALDARKVAEHLEEVLDDDDIF